jgi:UPF0755 protein
MWAKTALGAALVLLTLPLAAITWLLGRGAKLRLTFVIIALPMLVVLLYGVHWYLFSNGSGRENITLEIKPGMTFRDLADTLADLRAIRHPGLFRAMARAKGLDRSLHVGLYVFSPQHSPRRILKQLANHEQVYLQFTLVEGAVMHEALPRIAERANMLAAALDSAVIDKRRLARMGSPTGSLEGYLFPETYTVPWGTDAGTVVDAMLDQFDRVWSRVARDYHGGMTRHQLVTLASLIEAEAKDGDERKLISSVFHNRLSIGMRLQCDPTVVYALGGIDRPLLRTDWDYPSPYNTYLVAGLPPGPICSPGEASLRAALYPDTTKYLYFMARGDGTHKFSRTLAEHTAAYLDAKRNARP